MTIVITKISHDSYLAEYDPRDGEIWTTSIAGAKEFHSQGEALAVESKLLQKEINCKAIEL